MPTQRYQWHPGVPNRISSQNVDPSNIPTYPPPVIIPPTGDWLFQDNFDNGTRANSQNGISYLGTANSVPAEQSIQIEVDAGSESGYCLAFNYRGGALDGLLEQHFQMPNLTQGYFEMLVHVPSNYKHHVALPNNNKFLRVWDTTYSNSGVHLGMSIDTNNLTGLEYNDYGRVIGEYQWDNGTTGQMGNHSMGPYTHCFTPDHETRVGLWLKPETAKYAFNGEIAVYVDGIKKAERLGIQTWLNEASLPGQGPFFGRGHLFGHSNSGFETPVKLRLRWWGIANEVPY